MSIETLQLPTTLPAPPTAPAVPKTNAAARKAAEDFEAIFINELLSHMDQGLSTEKPFTGGSSEGVYRSFFDDAVAKEIAKRGGIGVADNIYREILKLQEAKKAAGSATGAQTGPTPVSHTPQNQAAPKSEVSP